LIRHDLGLSYAEVGLVLTLPGLLGSALDPLIGFAGNTRRRATLIFAGGLVVFVSTTLSALAVGFWTLLVAGLYGALPRESGTAVAVAGIGGLAGACVPAVLGFLAQAFGLGPTMWLLLIGPAALLACIPHAGMLSE
jgi:hypothetical protein